VVLLSSNGGAGDTARDRRAPDARTPARLRTGVRMLPTTRSGSTLEADLRRGGAV